LGHHLAEFLDGMKFFLGCHLMMYVAAPMHREAKRRLCCPATAASGWV
jgi:hypothetical protein